MPRCRVLVLMFLLCSTFPLGASLIVENFSGLTVPAGWTPTTANGNFSITFDGNDAIFSRTAGSGSGFARLTYGSPVSGDFVAAAVITHDYSLVNGGSMAFVGNVGGVWFDAYLRGTALNSIEAAAYNSSTGDNPWISWTGEGVLVLMRTGNTIQAGFMSSVPYNGGVPDLSGFTPLAGASWTGDQYLGNMTFQLSFGQELGTASAENAHIDLVGLATPPYLPDIIPPGGAAVPEPATAGLLAAGVAAILLRRRLRRSRD